MTNLFYSLEGKNIVSIDLLQNKIFTNAQKACEEFGVAYLSSHFLVLYGFANLLVRCTEVSTNPPVDSRAEYVSFRLGEGVPGLNKTTIGLFLNRVLTIAGSTVALSISPLNANSALIKQLFEFRSPNPYLYEVWNNGQFTYIYAAVDLQSNLLELRVPLG